MNRSRFFAAVAVVLFAAAIAPDAAEARHHQRYYSIPYHYSLPYPISYLHNHGPGPLPGTFAYYDGPSNALCYHGSAAYLGQDHRRHPCF